MKQPIKMTPGDDLHLTMLMALYSLNLVTGQDRRHLLGYGRAAFEAGKASQCLLQIQEPASNHSEIPSSSEMSNNCAAAVAVPAGFFSYCDDDGFNKHDTLEAAKADAQNVIDMLREEAGTDEWPGAVDSVCYGVIVGKSTEVPQEPGPNGEETADYLLLAATPEAVNPSETPNSSTIAVPRGWKLVPDDATPEWIENLEALPDWREAVGECIKKFLAAAPAAPQAAPAAVAVPDEREAFEAFARKYGTWDIKRDDVPHLGIFSYTDVVLVVAWHVWQARAALAATPAAPELHREWRSAFQEAVDTMEAEIDSRGDAENVRRMKRATSVLRSMLAATPAADEQDLDFVISPAALRADDLILVPRSLLGSACHAINKKRDAPKTLAELRRYAFSYLPASAPVVLPEPAAVVIGPAMGLQWRTLLMPDGDITGKKLYTEQQVRALLATGGQAHAVHDRHGVTPNIDKWKLVDGDIRESCDGLLTYHADAYREGLADAPQQADARDAESDYQRGYRHGYNRRDAEVQGALL